MQGYEGLGAVEAALGWSPEGADDGFGGKKGGKGKDGKGKMKGKIAYKVAQGEPMYIGGVQAFHPDKKHGYIHCEDIFTQTGQDVYVFQDVLERSGAGPGDIVAFFIHWSARGQPQASNPLLRVAAQGAHALKGVFKPGKDGTFGFVDCDLVKEISGRDVYVGQNLAQGFQHGQVVKINIRLNAQGQPNADSIDACEPDWEPMPFDLAAQGGFGEQTPFKGGKKGKEGDGGEKGAKGGKKGWDSWDSTGGKGKGWEDSWWQPQQQPQPPQQQQQQPAEAEWVPTWNKGAKGFGGKPAKGGKGIGFGGAPTPTGRICYGVVKSFNEVNNFGFIECDEVRAEYGNDVFLHGKSMGEVTGIHIGQMVQFEVAVSAKGQPQAINLQTLTADDAAVVSASNSLAESAAKKARTNGNASAVEEAHKTVQQAIHNLLTLSK